MNIDVCGRMLEGKTTLAFYLLRQRHCAIVAFDPRGMMAGRIVWSPEQLEEEITERGNEDEPIIYRFDDQDTGAQFDAMCEVLFPPRFTRGGFGLLVDEAQMLQSPHKMQPSLDRAMKQHPTYPRSPMRESVTIVQTTHRMVNLHNDNKAIMDEFFIFHTTLRKDLETIEDMCGAEVADIVANLPIHHCVRYKYGRQATGPQFEVWSDPSVWYTPLIGSADDGEQLSPESEEVVITQTTKQETRIAFTDEE